MDIREQFSGIESLFLQCWCKRLKSGPLLGTKIFYLRCHLTSTNDKFLKLCCHFLFMILMVFGVFVGVLYDLFLLVVLFRQGLMSSNLAWHSLCSQWWIWAPHILDSSFSVVELQVCDTSSDSKLSIFNLSYCVIVLHLGYIYL